MLKKANRLSSTYEFNKVRRLGKKYTARYFHIFYMETKSPEDPTRIGVVVSTKFHKSAVKRNKVGRRFKKAIADNFGRIRSGLWIVIHPKFSSIEVPYEKISVDVTETLQKVHILKDSA